MFTPITSRKSSKVAILALVVATLSFTSISNAQAGGLSFSLGGMTMDGMDNVGDRAGNRDASMATGMVLGFIGGAMAAHQRAHDQRYYDDKWSRLQAEDAQIHQDESANGYSVAIQHKHDCNYAAKIRALIAEMERNKAHYLSFHTKTGDEGAASEQETINYWTGKLAEAEKACGAKLY